MTAYYGLGGEPGGSLVLVADDAMRLGVLAHDPWHCASGYGWGSEGPPARELARCLLIDHFGRHAWCGGCEGTGMQTITTAGPVPFDRRHTAVIDVRTCNACQAERTSFPPQLIERLTVDVTSRLPGVWLLTTGDLDTWLRTGAVQ